MDRRAHIKNSVAFAAWECSRRCRRCRREGRAKPALVFSAEQPRLQRSLSRGNAFGYSPSAAGATISVRPTRQLKTPLGTHILRDASTAPLRFRDCELVGENFVGFTKMRSAARSPLRVVVVARRKSCSLRAVAMRTCATFRNTGDCLASLSTMP